MTHFFGTRDHDSFMEQQEKLSELSDSGELTRAQLDQAMRSLYDDGDYIDRSIGFAWLCENPQRLQATADRLGFQVDDFLMEHGSVTWVGSRILLNSDLLRLVPADRREQFVHDVYIKYGAFNNYWIDACLEAGINRSLFGYVIYERLLHCRDDAEENSTVSEATDFIEYGGSNTCANPPWSVMDDDTFLPCISQAAPKAPRRFFEKRREIDGRIGADKFAKLARGIIDSRDQLTKPQQDFVSEQEPAYQVGVLRRLKGSPEMVIRVLVNMDEAEGTAVYTEMSSLLDSANAASLYRSTWEIRHPKPADPYAKMLFRPRDAEPVSEERTVKAPWLEKLLERRLVDNGYHLGIVRQGEHRGRRQLEVYDEAKGHKYVLHRHQRGYYPSVGDQVIVTSHGAYQPHSRLSICGFLPATNMKEVRTY